MVKLGEAGWPLDQTGHLETQEDIPVTINYCSDHKEAVDDEKQGNHKEQENDEKEQGDEQEDEEEEEESPLPKIIPTYAPQEPREDEAADEDEGESSISTDLHSWCSMPVLPPYDHLEASESKSNDADDVFVDWTKEIPTEEETVTREEELPKIPARTRVGSFECRRKQVAAFCERYWGPSISPTSSSTVRQKVFNSNNFRAKSNRQYFGNQQRCFKRKFSHRFSDDFSGEEEYCQRNIRRGFNQRHSDSAAATFHRGVHLDKGPPSCFRYHKEPHGSSDSFSNSNSKRNQNVYRSSGIRSWNHNNNDSASFESTT